MALLDSSHLGTYPQGSKPAQGAVHTITVIPAPQSVFVHANRRLSPSPGEGMTGPQLVNLHGVNELP
jgi:hypothetical protein